MKLVIGLGNPGKEYSLTRHNAGYMLIDKLSGKDLPSNVHLQKTDTFMNDSGSFVKKALDYYKISLEDLFIVHDDLDLGLGEYKIQLGVGPKDHNGILDIEEKLANKNFWRVRIGIDARAQDNRIPGETYVLQKFNKEELELLNSSLDTIAKDLLLKLHS